MTYGPIELTVIKFPGNEFKGEIAPAIKSLIDAGTVRIIDILFIKKDKAGDMAVVEINEIDDDAYDAFGPLVKELAGLLSEEDARQWAAAMEPNSSIGLILFENLWASRVVEAVNNAKGKVVFSDRIPRAVIEKLMADKVAA